MFFNAINLIELNIEIWIGNQSQGKQRLQGPSIMLQAQFNDIVNQIAQSNAPAKVKFSQPYYLENGQITEQYICYANNKYLNEFGEESVWI